MVGEKRQKLNLAQPGKIRSLLLPEQIAQMHPWRWEKETPLQPWHPRTPTRPKEPTPVIEQPATQPEPQPQTQSESASR
jgi:hypothetical protein